MPGFDYKTQRKIRIGSKSHAYAVRLKKAPSLAIEGWDALPAVLSQETPGQPRQQKLKREQGTSVTQLLEEIREANSLSLGSSDRNRSYTSLCRRSDVTGTVPKFLPESTAEGRRVLEAEIT